MRVLMAIKELEEAIEKARYADPAYEPGRGESSVKSVTLDFSVFCATNDGQVGEVVIANSQNKEWVSRLVYSLERAGFKLTEDYPASIGSDRILVFNEK